jgi:hypothetical protein
MDDTADTDTEAPTVPVISAGAFDDLRALLHLVTNAQAISKHLASLRAATLAHEKALAELTTARAEHDASVAKDRAEIERGIQGLREREAKIAAADGNLQHREQVLAARLAALDLRTGRVRQVGGITQVFAEDFPDQAEPPADAHSREAADDDLQIPAGVSLTRSPSRSARGARIR